MLSGERFRSCVAVANLLLLAVIAIGVLRPSTAPLERTVALPEMKDPAPPKPFELPRKHVQYSVALENDWHIIRLVDGSQFLCNLRNGALAPIASDHVFSNIP